MEGVLSPSHLHEEEVKLRLTHEGGLDTPHTQEGRMNPPHMQTYFDQFPQCQYKQLLVYIA